jgi:hypothetical protein
VNEIRAGFGAKDDMVVKTGIGRHGIVRRGLQPFQG